MRGTRGASREASHALATEARRAAAEGTGSRSTGGRRARFRSTTSTVLFASLAALLAGALVSGGVLGTPSASAASATSVTSVTGPSPSPDAAGYQAIYTVGFTTSASGALEANSGTITLSAPAGTAFPSEASDYSVNGVVASSVSGGSTPASVTVTTPVAIADSASVTVVAASVTNPSTPSDTYTLAVSTSSDTAPADTPAYSIATAVSNLTGPSPSTSAAGAQGVAYTISFATSASGALAEGSGTIDVVAPPGTSLPSVPGAYSVEVAGVTQAATAVTTSSSSGSSSANEASVTVPSNIGDSTAVTLGIDSVTNPGPGTGYVIGLSTSSDTAQVNTPPYSIGSAVSSVAVSVNPDVTGEPALYHVTFVPANELLSPSGTITLSAPAGTVMPTTASDYVVDGVVASSVKANASSAVVSTPVDLPSGQTASVDVSGVTNPAANTASNPSYTDFYVSTSVDTVPVANGSPGYQIHTSLSSVGLSIAATPTSSDTSLSKYTVTFTTSASGALPADTSGSYVTLSFPCSGSTGTTLPSSASAYVFDATTPASVPPRMSGSCDGGDDTVTIEPPIAIGASSSVSVTISGVSDPAPGNYTFQAYTSADQAPATSSSYSVPTAPTTLESVRVAAGPEVMVSGAPSDEPAAGQLSNYVVTITTSASGALSQGSGTITLDFPSGSVLPPASSSAYSVDGVVASSVSVSGTSATITTPVAIGPRQAAAIGVAGVTNPPEGSYQVQAYTSSDTVPLASANFSIGYSAPTAPGFSASSTTSLPSAFRVSFDSSSAGGTSIDMTDLSGTAVFPVSASAYTVDVNGSSDTVSSVSCSSSCTSQDLTLASPIPQAASVSVSFGASSLPSNVEDAIELYTTGSSPAAGDPTPRQTPWVTFGKLSGSVGSVSVTPVPSTVSASAVYEISGVEQSNPLNPGEQVTLAFPSGTVLPSSSVDYTVQVVSSSGATGGVEVATSVSVSGTTATVTSPIGAEAGDSVILTIASVTNPSTPGNSYTLTMATSVDAAGTSAAYSITPVPTAVSAVGGPAPNPPYAGSSATYTITFTPTTTVSGSSSPPGYVEVVDPSGETAFPTSGSDYTLDGVTAASVSTSACPSGSTCAVVTLASGQSLQSGSQAILVIDSVTNPPAGTYVLEVSTSSDTEPVATPSYTIEPAPTAVAAGSVTPSPAAAGESANYTLTFTPSATGALEAGSGTITFSAPSQTSWPAAPSAYAVEEASSGFVAAATVSVSGTSVVITTPVSLSASVQATVVAAGVTNPAAGTYSSANSDAMEVSTSSDQQTVAEGSYTISNAISDLSGPNPTPATAGSTSATYTLAFTTSASGALSAVTGTIDVVAPCGTGFPSSGWTVDSTATLASTSSSSGCSSSDEAKVTVPPGASVGDSASVKVAVSGVTNPPAGTYVLYVSTSADTYPVGTSPYEIGTQVSSLTGPSPSLAYADALSTYTIGFTTSATGALAGGASTITLSGPSGTAFPSSIDDYTIDGVVPSALAGAGTDTAVLTLPSELEVPASSNVSIVVVDVTNPSQSGTYSMEVSTSADPVPASSPSYSLSAPPVPSVTGVSPSSGPATGGTTVTVTGSGFVPGASVDFGTVAASDVTVDSATQLTALSPPNLTGAVDVTVTTPGGTSPTSSADLFTYEAAYTALTPTRICDTRSGNPSNLSGAEAQCNDKTLEAGKPLDVTVAGIAGVPSTGVSAVVLNVTAVDESASGYLTVYPAGSSQPSTSNLNFTAGDTVANLTEVGVGSNDQVSIVSDVATDVVVDLEGYYSVPSSTGAGLYNGLVPARICDTRSGNPSNLSGAEAQCNNKTLSANQPLSIQVTGVGGVPSTGVSAVALNLTAVGFRASGYVSAYPAGSKPPVASNVNFHPGEGPVPNRVIVSVGSGGEIEVVSDVATNVVIDVDGYFTSAGGTGTQFNAEASPVRIVDTRCSASSPPSFCSSEDIPSANSGLGPLGPGQSMTVQVTGTAGVPPAARAVVLNVTVTDTTAASYLTVYPGGARPTASDLNWTSGETVPNLVIATLGSGGTVTIYNYVGSTQVVVDVMGWYQ